ncbi:MAG: hypothetical protein HY954_03325 [Deltaproteobacteria bacterium]|nr:hypothetical protein [Deltaproteobacteria bacterium]
MSGRYRKMRKALSIGGNVLRILLLIVTLAALSTLTVWRGDSALVDKADARIVDLYGSRYSSRLDAVKALLNESKTSEARAALESLVSELGKVRKQDRLAPTYAESLEMLIYTANRQGDSKRAIEASKAQVDLDKNHYNYWLNYAYLLNAGGDKRGAIDALYNAYRINPASLQVTEPLASILYEEKRNDDARRVVEGYLKANRGGTISVFYSSEGEEFSVKKSSRLLSATFTGKPQSFSFPVNSVNGIKKLRIDLPGLLDASVKVGRISINTAEGPYAVDFRGLDYGLHDLDGEGDTLMISGLDPFIEFILPEELLTKNISSIGAEVEIFQQLPDRLSHILRDGTI